MNAKLSRWGNSLAIRIPAAIAAEASLTEGCPLSIELSEGTIRLVPLKLTPSLEDLVAGITEENLHDEVETGSSLGNESW